MKSKLIAASPSQQNGMMTHAISNHLVSGPLITRADYHASSHTGSHSTILNHTTILHQYLAVLGAGQL